MPKERGENYIEPPEGVVDINKVTEERDELDRLCGKLNDLISKQDEVIGQFKNLLSMVSDPKPCKGCGRPIYWVISKNGKSMPITDEGLNHFIDCPEANKFRKKKNE